MIYYLKKFKSDLFSVKFVIEHRPKNYRTCLINLQCRSIKIRFQKLIQKVLVAKAGMIFIEPRWDQFLKSDLYLSELIGIGD